MRPYVENGKTPKKKSRRGEKAVNGVKKSVKTSLVKAKTSAVKTKRKLESKDAEEVADLLEQTQNGHPETPQGKILAQKVAKASTPNKQMKKLKSLVSMEAVKDIRRSKRLSQKSSAPSEVEDAPKVNGVPNGDQNGDHNGVEVGVDAMEIVSNGGETKNSSNGGLLQRTMSKIWQIPQGITGVPYADIQSPSNDDTLVMESETPTETSKDTTDGKRASCVIS